MLKRLEEQWLLYQVQTNKNQEAFTELYNRYTNRIYRFVLLKVSNVQDAEDVTSDTFLRAWDYLTAGEDRVTHFSGFVYQVARNLIVDVYRRRAKQPEAVGEIDETMGGTHEPLRAVEAQEDADRLLKKIRTLKQEYQEVILLKHIDGLSIGEIAKITGKRPTAVRVTLHRALTKLREITESTPQ